MSFFKDDPRTAYEAKVEAQRIAFAPVMFQACRILRDAGILELIQQSREAGMTLNEVVSKINLPRYGIKVLLESGLGIGLFRLNDGRYTLTKLGYFMFRDAMTRVNMDVMHEVCYRGLFDLDKSIEQGKPVGEGVLRRGRGPGVGGQSLDRPVGQRRTWAGLQTNDPQAGKRRPRRIEDRA